MRMRLAFNLAISASLLIFLACSNSGSSNKPAVPAPGAPELTDVDPEVNDSSALLGAAIITTFDQDMEPAAVDTFVVYGTQTGKLTGAYLGGGTDTLSFDPDFGFKIGEEIEVILTDSLSSTGGLFLDAPVVYRFRAETRGGSGNFTAADTVSNQTNTSALASGDWDGDGDLDLASANNGLSRVDILINDGTGDFTAADTVSNQTNTSALVAGDWDGDGDLDLASANNGASRVDILINDGTGDFTAADTVSGQTNTRGLASGDWDGDGDLDLASANDGLSRVDILINDGTGDFTATDTVSGQTNTRGLASGDWDGDDDLDLASANFGNSTVTALENQP